MLSVKQVTSPKRIYFATKTQRHEDFFDSALVRTAVSIITLDISHGIILYTEPRKLCDNQLHDTALESANKGGWFLTGSAHGIFLKKSTWRRKDG